MSTAAHEPRRVGPRRAESPSGSQAAPRRNASESGEPIALRYDSDELPVLIRLPNLHDAGTGETQVASSTHKKWNRIDSASAGTQMTSRQQGRKEGKKAIPQQAGNSKLVFGGIAGGILIVALLFLFKSGTSKSPADPDGWTSEADGLGAVVQEPQIDLPGEDGPPPLYPGFAYEAPDTPEAQYAGGEPSGGPAEAPYLSAPSAPGESETAAVPNNNQPVVGWPSEAVTGQINPSTQRVDQWPGESLSREQSGYEYPATDSSGQLDYRSSVYPSDAETYRMGKLNSDRPPAAQGDRSSILNGNIEIPDTTSIR